MPLSSVITTPIFTANLAANAIVGISSPSLAFAIANGLELYAASGLQVKSVNAGTAGTGVGTGIGVVMTPPALIAAFTASFSSNGILGVMAVPMISALSLSFSQVMLLGNVLVSSVGVGVGAGVTSLIPNPVASASSWIAGFAAAGMVGPTIPQLAAAISQGFDTAAATAVGAVVIAGPPSSVPGSGVGFGKIF